MTKAFCLVLTLALISATSPAQNSSQQQNTVNQPTPSNAAFAAGTQFRAELDKTLDAKKLKPGDPVHAKTMDELKSGTEVIAPRGAKIVGHVVAANPHEKDAPSRLEIAFDKLQLGNGSEIPLKATIQALAKPLNNVPPGPDNMSTPMGGSAPMGTNRGGMQPGTMGQPASLPNPGTMGSPGSTPTPNPSSEISLNAQGVQDISGLSLSAGPSADSVLTSEKHNVKLDSGTQMILRVQ
ncbi:MAG TPA: hypothetical protein VEH30_08220 [Terriglobales bacterium]|nr:hypothetical protein [Terriglobales bacterium]